MKIEKKNGEESTQNQALVEGHALSWRRDNSSFAIGEQGVLGSLKFVVFRVTYEGCLPKRDDKPYRLTCKLPGLQSDFGHFPDSQEAKKQAQVVLDFWVKNAGLCYSKEKASHEKL